MKRKIYQQRNTEIIQNKTYIWAEVFFFLTYDQAFFVFFLRDGLDPVTTQSNYLLGNPRYTLTECLLANLTHLWFVFGFFLARKNGSESVWFSETFHLNTRYRSRLCCLAFLARPRPCLSHAQTDYKSRTQCSRRFTYERLLWDIPEIIEAKDDELADVKKIIRV